MRQAKYSTPGRSSGFSKGEVCLIQQLYEFASSGEEAYYAYKSSPRIKAGVGHAIEVEGKNPADDAEGKNPADDVEKVNLEVANAKEGDLAAVNAEGVVDAEQVFMAAPFTEDAQDHPVALYPELREGGKRNIRRELDPLQMELGRDIGEMQAPL